MAGAKFCKQCGAPLTIPMRLKSGLDWNPWFAVVLSVVPGLGHVYRCQRLKGAGWLLAVAFAYLSFPLGLALHLVCALNAGFSGAIEYPAAAPGEAPDRCQVPGQ